MASVKLFVYDLSNGLARQMSRQLTGRQIDGIWHTSVVVYGKEIFYGQGINIMTPGTTHHGRPLQTLDMGETGIDEATFEEYLDELRGFYTAEKYHLLDFNCNSFTNDCIGFLTGGSIPDYIKDLPSDFLSTSFGMMLRPIIDNMYRRPTDAMRPPALPSAPQPVDQPVNDTQLMSTLLQSVASRAAGSPSGVSTPSTATVAAPIHISTNPTSFNSALSSHRAAVVFFTSATCGPCRMIAPVFEELAQNKTKGKAGGIVFIKVDLSVGMSSAIASQYGVRVTPTFVFFLDGQKKSELSGVNAPELRTQVDLLLFEAFPPHKHTSLRLPAVEALSLNPILFTQAPSLDTVRDKLLSFIGTSNLSGNVQVKTALTTKIIPWLKTRFVEKGVVAGAPIDVSSAVAQTANTLVENLPSESLFPFLDLWRLGMLDSNIASATQQALIQLLAIIDSSVASTHRATLLTFLRLMSNALGSPLARPLLVTNIQAKAALTNVLVQTLLHADRLVRVAAASVAFNAASWFQRGRVARVKGQGQTNGDGAEEGDEDEEWRVEIVSAVVQAIANEQESEDIVHRLAATYAFLVRLSPNLEAQLYPLLEVLQVKQMLEDKLAGTESLTLKKKDVRELVKEVADKLCT